MPQTVDMIIEYRGGSEKHLHLKKKTQPHIRLSAGGDSQVIWKVTEDPTVGPAKKPGLEGLTSVTIWFPSTPAVFVQSLTPPLVPVREVTIPLTAGSGSTTLTLNPSFDRGGLLDTEDFILPLAIYCSLDAGQGSNSNGNFSQKGRQMIDGDKSHPECNVGP